MDHSYSKERDRVQKTDHCYFTLGKKTPQVVLRKAQQLKEQAHVAVKSAIGQDHSYVRSENGVHLGSYDSELVQEIEFPDGQSQCIQTAFCQESILQSGVCVVSSLAEESRMAAAEALLTLDSTTFNGSVMDDLRSWIGSIQLDHTYGGQHGYNITGTENSANDIRGNECKVNFPGCISECVSNNQLDHANENKLDRHRSNSIVCGSLQVVAHDTGIEDTRSIIVSSTFSESENGQRFAAEKMLGDNGLITDWSVFQFNHCDHVYDSNVCESTNYDEFRSDHSYDAISKRGNCDSADWWDHAYVDCGASSPSWGSCSRDIGLAGPMVDLVAGAIV